MSKTWFVIMLVLLTANNVRTFIQCDGVISFDLGRTSLPQTFNSDCFGSKYSLRGGNCIHDWVWAERQFMDANVSISSSEIRKLPSTQELLALLGETPLFLDGKENGDDQCSKFQGHVSEEKRWIGVAGLFNTGTNLLYTLLYDNCEMPGNNNDDRVHWQVPWGKHEFANISRSRTALQHNSTDKDDGLAVVVIKDPYDWIHSMCRNPYLVKWNNVTNHCPDLSSTVTAWKTHKNIMQFWNEWYEMYINHDYFPYPKVMIKFEDLVIRPKETISKICSCAGGSLRVPFKYVVTSAKNGAGHNSKTGMFEAWSQFHWPKEAMAGLSSEDFKIAKESLDDNLMALFKYLHPPDIERV